MALHEYGSFSQKTTSLAAKFSSDDACISDIDHLINSLSNLKAEDFRPDLIGSIITHYAYKWLPEIAGEETERAATPRVVGPYSPEGRLTSSWIIKRFFMETLVGILPPEKDIVSCDFLLRLLRVANMGGVGATTRAELEERVSWQLEEASLRELMIPSFSHSSMTLLDVELVLRLLRRFMDLGEVSRTRGALVKVAKLVDCYLAEAAVDFHLGVPDFFALASLLPYHARSTDDGLYRAIDTYLKVHPGLSKQDRKGLCDLINCRKLSAEACFHAAQNERLPIRAVIQILLSEQTKLYNHIDYSASFSGTRSAGNGLESAARCNSKRGMSMQQMEIKRLKEDILRLQSQCMNMEAQVERLCERKRGKSGNYFSWKKLFTTNKTGESGGECEVAMGLNTPSQMKAGLLQGKTSTPWRKSLS